LAGVSWLDKVDADSSMSYDIVLSAAGKYTDNGFASLMPTKYVQHNLHAFGIFPAHQDNCKHPGTGTIGSAVCDHSRKPSNMPMKMLHAMMYTTPRHHKDVSSAHVDHPCRLLRKQGSTSMDCKCDVNRLLTPQGMQKVYQVQFRHDVWH